MPFRICRGRVWGIEVLEHSACDRAHVLRVFDCGSLRDETRRRLYVVRMYTHQASDSVFDALTPSRPIRGLRGVEGPVVSRCSRIQAERTFVLFELDIKGQKTKTLSARPAHGEIQVLTQ